MINQSQQPVQDSEEQEQTQCPQCDEYKARWIRVQADYQNLQKEVARQRSEWAQMSTTEILYAFIPVYENFKKAFAHQPVAGENGWEKWAQGIGFIKKQFGDILHLHQVEEMKTVGEIFDPTRHEAIGDEFTDEYNDGVVVREIEGGYVMNERVVKTAKVIIAKKKQEIEH